MIKNHTADTFDPAYVGDYHIASTKGNQVLVIQATGDQTKVIHISGVKYVLPADNVTSKLLDYS